MRLGNLIVIYGPEKSGKSYLAKILANNVESNYVNFDEKSVERIDTYVNKVLTGNLGDVALNIIVTCKDKESIPSNLRFIAEKIYYINTFVEKSKV